MSDYNTAALAAYEHEMERDQTLWDLYAKQAKKNLLERMLDERPRELLNLIEDYGIGWLNDSSDATANSKMREILTSAIRGRDDCAFGANIIDAACKLWVETLPESVVWDEIRSLDGR